jgi:urease accessory protein
MRLLNRLLPAGRGLAPVLVRRAAVLALDWDLRQKSRFEAHTPEGQRLGIVLPRGSVIRGGDVLVAEDGELFRVIASPQPVMEVRPCATHGRPFDLVRAAYHLGNRHVPLQLSPEWLRFEPDPVLADMLRQMHLTVTDTEAEFEPEGGAYASSRDGHAHPHAHGHSHHAHD